MARRIPKPLLAGAELPDPAEDLRRARKIGLYRVSEQAVYFAAFPGTLYLPCSAIREAFCRQRQLTTTGSCGKSVPVPVVVLRYGEGEQRILEFHTQKQAEQFLDLIQWQKRTPL